MENEKNDSDRIGQLEARLAGLEGRLKKLEDKPVQVAAAPFFQAPRPGAAGIPGTVLVKRPTAKSESFPSADKLFSTGIFSYAGIAAFILGVAFFLKYAFEQGWIGPWQRVVGGILTGIALLFVGHKLDEKQLKGYSQTLMGGGLAVLYLSFYAGFHFYGIIPRMPAFLCEAVVTCLAVAMAFSHQSKIIAAIGMLGGFLTPVLLSTGVWQHFPLFTYLIILDIGIVGFAMRMDWREFNLSAFALTQMWLQWYIAVAYKQDQLMSLWVFASAFFTIFLAVTLVRSSQSGKSSETQDLALLIGNAFLYYATIYYKFLEHTRFESLEAPIALVLAVLYVLCGQQTRACNSQDRYLVLSELGVAAAFATVAIPIAFDWQWVSILLGAEACALLWLGFEMDSKPTRMAALGLFAATCLHLMIYDAELRGAYGFLFNTRTAAFVFVIAAMAGGLYLYRRNVGKVEKEELGFAQGLAGALNFMCLFWLSLEARDYWKDVYPIEAQRHWHIWSVRGPSPTLFNRIQVSYSVIWTIYALALMGVGIRKSLPALRTMAAWILGAVTLKVFVFDLSTLSLGPRVISFLALGSILLLASYGYQKYVTQPSAQEPRHPD